MSTTFAIEKAGKKIDVAFRAGGSIIWINDLASLLPDATKVTAIDNTRQGIYTIGDIKRANKETNNARN